MDMKKILQAFDGASTKPVEGSSDMAKFMTIVNEGANPHKVSLPVQMAMQHYAEPVVEKPRTIKEVKKTAMSGLLHQYYVEAQQEVEDEAVAKKELISEQARRIAERVLAKEGRLDELSKDTLKSYVKANKEDTVQRASSDSFTSGKAGDKYNKADETHKDKVRQKGLDRALDKLADPEYGKKNKEEVKENLDNPIDRVSMDIPLLLRVMEYAREDAKTDMDLHFVLERLTKLSQEGRTLSMGDYDTIVGAGVGTNEGRHYHSYHDELQQYDRDQGRAMGRHGREDDEYHVPDPVDNRIQYKVIATVTTQAGTEEKKGVSVKTVSGPKHAESVAKQHLENAGFQVKSIDSVHDLGPV